METYISNLNDSIDIETYIESLHSITTMLTNDSSLIESVSPKSLFKSIFTRVILEDRKISQRIEKYFQCLCDLKIFQTIAPNILKLTQNIPAYSTDNWYRAVVRMSFISLRNNELVKLNDVIISQLNLLSKINHDNILKGSLALFNSLFTEEEKELYITKSLENKDVYFKVTCFMLHCIKNQSIIDNVINSFVSVISNARKPISSIYLQAAVNLSQYINNDNLKNIIIPPLSRAIKRNPEIIVPIVAPLMIQTRLDWSAHLSALAPAIFSLLKQSDVSESVFYGVTMNRNTLYLLSVQHSTDSYALIELMKTLCSQMDSFKVDNTTRSTIYYTFLLGFRQSEKILSQSELKKYSEGVYTLIETYLYKELNPLCKAYCLELLGMSMKYSGLFSTPLQQFFEKSLKSPSTISYYTLIAISYACQNTTLISKLSSFDSYYTSFIESGKQKPGLYGKDAAVSIAIKMTLSLLSTSSISDEIQNYLKEDSIVYVMSIYTTNKPEETDGVHNAATAISRAISLLFRTSDYTNEMLVLLHIKLSCSTYKYVADCVNGDIKNLVSTTSTSLHSLYIHTFIEYIVSLSLIPVLPDEPVVQSSLLYDCLKNLFVGVIPETSLVELCFACHFPLLSNQSFYSDNLWRKFVSVITDKRSEGQSTEEYMNIYLQNLAICTSTYDYLIGVNGIYSQNSFCRSASQRVFLSLSHYSSFFNEIFPQLYSYILDKVDHHRSTEFTEDEINIYQTPSFIVYVPPKRDDEYVPEVVYSNNVRKPKYMKGNFGADDAKWAEEVRREAMKDKIAREEAEKALHDKTKLLAEQQLIRDKVTPLANDYLYSLEFMNAIATIEPTLLYSYLNNCLTIVEELEKTFISLKAKNCYISFCKCIPDSLSHLYTDMYKSLVFVLENTTQIDYIPEFITSLLMKTETFLSENECIPAPTFCFYIPIFSYIIEHKRCHTLLTTVCSILDKHSNISEMPEEDVSVLVDNRHTLLSICLDILRISPHMDPSPEDILITLCDSPDLTSSEISLLISEKGLLSTSDDARLATLFALQSVSNPMINPVLVIRLWLLCYDDNKDIAEEAQQQWTEGNCHLYPTYFAPLLVLLHHKEAQISHMAARALVGGIKELPESLPTVLTKLNDSLNEDLKEIEERKINPSKTATSRALVYYVYTIAGQEQSLDITTVYTVLDMLFTIGVCDLSAEVKKQAIAAGEAIINAYSESYASDLTEYLGRKLTSLVEDENTPDDIIIKQDAQRVAAILMLGQSISHLPTDDARIFSTIDTLFVTLATPSETVQDSVAKCLALLFKISTVKDVSEKYVNILKSKISEGTSFSERRGAACALAGVLKGLSFKYLKTYNIFPFIVELCQSSNIPGREGALYAIQFLSKDLGVAFEVYLKELLPLLLDNFSHKDLPVREAALSASKIVMSNLTPFGVKSVLPIVQTGLNDSRWKTKEESLKMLGSMASCSPTSLSQCLPQIVPILTDACTDTHPKIQQAAKDSLIEIGRVIRTPEIADLQEILIKALIDPHIFTDDALKALTTTSFYHTVDAPSLSLIIPILIRGINERLSETKKRAALIIGNICSLATVEDVSPYLNKLISHLEKVLLDPQPEIRSVASHSMGMLTKEMNEDDIQVLLNWLVEHTYADTSVSERSGAAQGLAEVMAHITKERFNEILKELEDNFKHTRACVREGVLWTISFLPNTLQDRFPPLIPRLMPAIISGLADEADMVAEVSLKAGQVVVTVFGKSQMDHILPQLLSGMMDPDWRIRQSSARLTGDLLYALGGIKAVGMSEEENDVGLANSNVEQVLLHEIGVVRWHKILAYLFFLTTDSTVAVRQTAFQVWKSVVSNTPRTLKTCIEDVTTLCIDLLSGSDEDGRILASRCLGEVVQKLAEYVLPSLIPVLQNKLQTEDVHLKQGVCYGLVEIIQSCSSGNLKEYGDSFLESIKISICDNDDKVREASAIALKELQKRGDGTALTSILPYLLEDLESGDAQKTSNGLNGLIQLITIQGKTVITALFPRLVCLPLTKPRLDALTSVTTVTSKYIHFYNKDLIHTLLTQMCGNQEDEVETKLNDADICESIRHACGAMCANISDMGIQWTCTTMDKISDSINPGWRREGCYIIEYFINNTNVDFSTQIPMLLKGILNRSVESDKETLKACWNALTALFTRVPDEVLLTHLTFFSSHLSSIISQAKHRPGVDAANYILPALAQPMSLKPLLKCMNKGIITGSSETRTECANLYTELIEYTPKNVLVPLCVTITGPIIRIIGDRCTPDVKTALLRTLTCLLQKCQIALKPFISQLQTTFTKALRDSDEHVRNQGAIALGSLMELSVRIDILVKEINDDIHTAPDGVKEALLRALFNICLKVADKISDENKHNIIENMIICNGDKEEVIRSLSASIMGILLKVLSEEDQKHVFDVLFTINNESSWEERHGHCLAISACIKYSPDSVIPSLPIVIDILDKFTSENNITIRQASMSTIEHILIQYTNNTTLSNTVKKSINDTVISAFLKLVEDPINTVRYQAIHSIKRYAKTNDVIPTEIFNQVIPALLKAIKDNYVPAKLGAERALLYFFHILDKQSTLLNDYAATIPAADGRYLKEYARRVLSKLNATSDDEDL